MSARSRIALLLSLSGVIACADDDAIEADPDASGGTVVDAGDDERRWRDRRRPAAGQRTDDRDRVRGGHRLRRHRRRIHHRHSGSRRDAERGRGGGDHRSGRAPPGRPRVHREPLRPGQRHRARRPASPWSIRSRPAPDRTRRTSRRSGTCSSWPRWPRPASSSSTSIARTRSTRSISPTWTRSTACRTAAASRGSDLASWRCAASWTSPSRRADPAWSR